jgi:hypothetical protein
VLPDVVSKISLEGKKNPPQPPNSLSTKANQLLRQLFPNILLRQKEFLTSCSQRPVIFSNVTAKPARATPLRHFWAR